MVFTTHFGLHSQTTRLFENVSQRTASIRATDGILTLYDAPIPKDLYPDRPRKRFYKLQFATVQSQPDFKFELFPLHSPLLGESLLVSFPPLIDMLKFSGYSYLI